MFPEWGEIPFLLMEEKMKNEKLENLIETLIESRYPRDNVMAIIEQIEAIVGRGNMRTIRTYVNFHKSYRWQERHVQSWAGPLKWDAVEVERRQLAHTEVTIEAAWKVRDMIYG